MTVFSDFDFGGVFDGEVLHIIVVEIGHVVHHVEFSVFVHGRVVRLPFDLDCVEFLLNSLGDRFLDESVQFRF